jgi:hypothetical protein
MGTALPAGLASGLLHLIGGDGSTCRAIPPRACACNLGQGSGARAQSTPKVFPADPAWDPCRTMERPGAATGLISAKR